MILKYNLFLNEKKYTHKNLSKKFWKNYKFDKEIRKKLLDVTDDFFKYISKDYYEKYKLKLEIIDIQLTGSLANYNYTPHSDLDIHIIVDIKDKKNRDMIISLSKWKTFVWNLKHDIVIRGADLEFYIQDKNEEHVSTGLFSLKDNKWIKKSKYSDPDVDEDDVKSKYEKWVYDIDKIVELSDKKTNEKYFKSYYNMSERLKEKIKKFRKKGLHEGGGEFSVENVTFKKLRSDGYLDKLFKTSDKLYDLIYSE
jgi:predicted nucleotidyltransferase